MLKLLIPAVELFDERTRTFSKSKETTLQLEHSLVSISKWESIWRKPFLSKEKKTPNEIIDYIKCMTITQNVDPNIYNYIDNKTLKVILDYIEAPKTATVIRETNSKVNREVITSEIIYYWMITYSVPFECQTWHLDRLLTLIKVINIKNQPKKKGTTQDIMARNRALNQKRLAELNTKG